MAMLVALMSGIIIHKRIFKDFFTFRPGKGQRSWLDGHNAVAVLTLPFQFMIAITGIAFYATSYLPAAVVANFGAGSEGQNRYAAAISDPGKPVSSGVRHALPALEPLARRAETLMAQEVRAVVIDNPGDAAMRIGIYGWNEDAEQQRRISQT